MYSNSYILAIGLQFFYYHLANPRQMSPIIPVPGRRLYCLTNKSIKKAQAVNETANLSAMYCNSVCYNKRINLNIPSLTRYFFKFSLLVCRKSKANPTTFFTY